MRTDVRSKAKATPGPSFTPVLGGLLQRKCACGGAAGLTGECAACSTKRLASRPPLIQTKLTIGAPNDKYEREADRVADQIMRMPEPGHEEDFEEMPAMPGTEEKLRRQPVEEEEEEDEEGPLQAKEISGRSSAPSLDLDARIQALKGSGQPLPNSVRAFFEPRFGHDFGRVRIHADGRAADAARSVNARAFTVGRDVVFGTGEYRPGTTSGKQLLAHELAHVVQQNPGTNRRAFPTGSTDATVSMARQTSAPSPLVQRALKCDLDHLDKECKNADASCLTVKDDCSNKYPKTEDIKELHNNAKIGAEAKKKDIPNAAANLLRFLDASGSEKVMPVDLFKKHKATKEALEDVHRDKFIAGAEKRLKDGRLTIGGSVDMIWTDTANAFDFTENDLGLAVGGYTLCSKVTVSAKDKSGGKIELTFDRWTVQAFDCYNWDPGKGIGALFGGVTDTDLCCLQNAGKGRHFRIRTDPWSNTHAPSMAKTTITASKTASSKKKITTKPKKKKSDDR